MKHWLPGNIGVAGLHAGELALEVGEAKTSQLGQLNT